ncbi:MAG: bifunctional alpha/beta hydrolase/OsmC family protein [Aliidongia sp.]
MFAHCFTCGKDVISASRIAAALTERGIATMRFDFTGLGSSDGEFANTHFSSNIQDLLAAVAHLRAQGRAPALLIGHSLGGAAVLAMAGRVPEAKAVAVIAAPFEPAHVLHLLAPDLPEIETRGEAGVTLGGRPFTIRRSFLDDLRNQPEQAARIAALGRPLLVLHSPEDATVSIDSAEQTYATAHYPKSFVALDRADHLLTRRSDADYVAALLATWAGRYLPAAVEAEIAAPPPGTVTVEETRHGRFQQDVRIGKHRLLADEPVAQGGFDTGPGPYDLLLAGLGACTSMTLRLYAERKGLPMGPVKVTLSHRKIHAEDCAECETKTGLLDEITRTIELPGPLDEAQRARLLEIADKCPVHRTLESEVRILTQEAGR